MTKLELPAAETIEVFGGVRQMALRTGRAPSTISSAKNGNTGFFPHWWTNDLIALAARDGIKLPAAQPRVEKAKPSKKRARAA